MKLNVYSIFDSAASAFNTPFYMQQDGLAIRAFKDNVNAGNDNSICMHPEQFTLFKLGHFDDKTAQFELLDSPKSLALGVELVNEYSNKFTKLDAEHILAAIKELKDAK